jgi:hypothetical protein
MKTNCSLFNGFFKKSKSVLNWQQFCPLNRTELSLA